MVALRYLMLAAGATAAALTLLLSHFICSRPQTWNECCDMPIVAPRRRGP
jgi:hypothetical protein